MRFVYHWNDTEEMSKVVHDIYAEVEDPVLCDFDVRNIWWVPTAMTQAFRFSDSYNQARERNGRVYEYPAIFEHSGLTFSGVFFVEYDSRITVAA